MHQNTQFINMKYSWHKNKRSKLYTLPMVELAAESSQKSLNFSFSFRRCNAMFSRLFITKKTEWFSFLSLRRVASIIYIISRSAAEPRYNHRPKRPMWTIAHDSQTLNRWIKIKNFTPSASNTNPRLTNHKREKSYKWSDTHWNEAYTICELRAPICGRFFIILFPPRGNNLSLRAKRNYP